LKVERDRFAFVQRVEALALNCREMYGHVFTTVLLDKTIAFGIDKPLNLTVCQRTSPPLSNVESVQILESKKQAKTRAIRPLPCYHVPHPLHMGRGRQSFYNETDYLLNSRQLYF
jgi:hypothetical protein